MKKQLKRKDLFTTFQVAKACSVSRSTILRLEDEGLAFASVKDESTGSRLYTPKDISRIMQLLSLQSLGFTRDDLRQFYTTSSGYSANIAALEAKVQLMTSFLDKLKDRGDTSRHNVVLERDLPAQSFYIKPINIPPAPSPMAIFMQDTFAEALAKGYIIDWKMSTCLIIYDPDIKARYGSNTPMDCAACVPVLPDAVGPNIFAAPAHHALCMLVVQSPANVANALLTLEAEAHRRNYKRVGPFCIYTIEDYYPGEPNDHTDHIAQISLPVAHQD